MPNRNTESLLRGITQKDAKQEVRRLLKDGWSIEPSGGSTHVRFTHDQTGAWFDAALTSSSRRAAIHIRKKAEKALRRRRQHGKEQTA